MRLQLQSKTSRSSSGVNFTGLKVVERWVPSQKGCLRLLPQEHHASNLPLVNCTLAGLNWELSYCFSTEFDIKKGSQSVWLPFLLV